MFPLPKKNFHTHTHRTQGKRRNRFLPQRRNSKVRFVVLYIRHPKHLHDLWLWSWWLMGGKRCGWVERGWTYTENRRRQIDTSSHFCRADFGTKNKNHYMVVWRQRMARQICLHENKCKIYMPLVYGNTNQIHIFLTGYNYPASIQLVFFIAIITSRVRWSSKHFGFSSGKTEDTKWLSMSSRASCKVRGFVSWLFKCPRWDISGAIGRWGF